jgi:hypothetical protein
MSTRSVSRFLCGLLLLLGTISARTEGFSSAQSIAFQDFLVWHCSRNEPARTAEFAKLRSPPHTCTAPNPAEVEKARKSEAYRAQNTQLAREMGGLSKRQLTEMCQAALTARC